MATIVQSKLKGKEVWYAIDPVVGKVMEVTTWYKHWLKSSTNGKLRMYIADASKFTQLPVRYDAKRINHKKYNNYFLDMMDWFENNDISRILDL